MQCDVCRPAIEGGLQILWLIQIKERAEYDCGVCLGLCNSNTNREAQTCLITLDRIMFL